MVNIRRFKLKNTCVQLLGGKCYECGYTECINALEFHHINPTTKCFEISGSHARSWNMIETELKKCKLLCANCHRKERCSSNYNCKHAPVVYGARKVL